MNGRLLVPGGHGRGRRAALALAAAVSLAPAPSGAIEFRSIDGVGNNLLDPGRGAAGSTLLRLAPSAYADGVSVPRGGDPASLPAARQVSQALAAQHGSLPNAAGASDWLWQWGQFIDHDLDLTPLADPAEAFDISVPAGDPFFDPGNEGDRLIGFDRSLATLATGTREQINVLTAYIDGSHVYGSDQARADLLRDFGNGGRMKMRTAASGETTLVYNTFGLGNAGGPGADLFVSGDERVNEQIGLTAAHILFSREHNRVAADLEARLHAADPALDPALFSLYDDAMTAGPGLHDEDDFIYHAARKVVSAQIQKITYEEFLPVLLGPGALAPYAGYDDGVDAGISNEFSTAAFRVGHTMLSPGLLRVDAAGASLGPMPLREAFFNPAAVEDHGVDSLLKGLAMQSAQAIDTRVVDEVRNFLFGAPGAGGFDLASLNIQRGRDHGLAAYNATRVALGLGAVADFAELSGGDATLEAAFASVYADVDEVDLWIGALAEPRFGDSLLGETFHAILVDQFTRTRDGDRFFYLRELDELSILDPLFSGAARLSDVIARNAAVGDIQRNVFLIAGAPSLSEPGSLALLAAGAALSALGLGRRAPGSKAAAGAP